MTLQEWFGLGAFVLACGGAVVSITRWLILREVSETVGQEREARIRGLLEAVTSRNAEMDKMRKDWADSQVSQDRQFGEVGLSLRRFIETVEKDMHEAELWGRDHYVQKADFEKAVDKLSEQIKAGNADLKADLKEMKTELSRN